MVPPHEKAPRCSQLASAAREIKAAFANFLKGDLAGRPGISGSVRLSNFTGSCADRVLDIHLGTDLDDPIGRYLEVVGRVVGRAGKRNEHAVLPARHSRTRRPPQRSAREEK